MKIDPTMFITRPYTECPRCKQKQFGMLSIYKERYSRRCVNCFYSGRYNLPKLNKKIIYIDQFAISNMMKAINDKIGKKNNVDEFYLHLFETLDTLVKMQLIVCPDSEFHRRESLLYKFDDLKRMYEHLSNGITFYDSKTIRRFQMCEDFLLLLGNNISKKTDVDSVLRGERNRWEETYLITFDSKIDIDEVNIIKKTRQENQSKINSIFQRWKTEKNNNFKDWLNEETEAYGSMIVERYINRLLKLAQLRNLKEVDSAKILSVSSSEENILIVSLMGYIEEKIGFDDAFKKVLSYLQSKRISKIKFVQIAGGMWAAIAHQAAHAGRNKYPNVGMPNDIEMVSTLLPYCDAMFLDKETHNILKFLKDKNVLFSKKTQLFSLNNKQDFIDYLNSIKSSVSKKHIKILKEIYGSDRLKPYTKMYNYEKQLTSKKIK